LIASNGGRYAWLRPRTKSESHRVKAVFFILSLAALGSASGHAQDAGQRLTVELAGTAVETVLRISGEGDLAYETRRLADPERFEVDVRGVIRSSGGRRPKDGPVAQMRVQQVQLEPEPISRVTLDLRGPVEPTIERRRSSVAVVFRSEGAAAPRGALFVSLDLSDLSPGSGGDRAAVDWVGPSGGRPTWFAGLATSRMAGTEWHVGRFGAVVKAGARNTFEGEAQVGGGRTGDDDGFDYRVIAAALTRELVPGRLFLRLEDRYLDVDAVRGNLAEAAFTFVPNPRLSTRLAYTRSTGGNFETDYVTGRVDVFLENRLRVLGGVALGRSRPEIFDVIGEAALDFEEAYVGVAFPVRGSELTAVVDRLELGDVERGTLSLSLRVPWGWGGDRERVKP